MFVQSITNNVSPAATTNVKAFSGQASGNFNLLFYWWGSSTITLSSVVGTNGNSYTLVDSIVNATAAWTVACYAAPRINPGADTITATFSLAVTSNLIGIEYQAVTAVDVHRPDNGTTQNPTSGSLTTLNQNDILVYFASMSSAETGGGAGYTVRVNANAGTQLMEDKIVGVPGSYTGSYTNVAANNWSSILIALQIAQMPSNIWGGGTGGAIVY